MENKSFFKPVKFIILLIGIALAGYVSILLVANQFPWWIVGVAVVVAFVVWRRRQRTTADTDRESREPVNIEVHTDE